MRKTKTVKWLQLGRSVQDPKAGSVCVAAGWGKTSNRVSGMSDVLMFVKVTAIDRKKCNSNQHYNGKPPIADSMVCAGSDSADTCQVRRAGVPRGATLPRTDRRLVLLCAGGFWRPAAAQRNPGRTHLLRGQEVRLQ